MLGMPIVLLYAVRDFFGSLKVLTRFLGDGKMYGMGLNAKYQLGLGDNKSRYFPTLIEKDYQGNELPLMTKVGCTYFGSFTVSDEDKVYSWGSGSLGHGDEQQIQRKPREVVYNVENRKFTDLYCTMKSSMFFSPSRILRVMPGCVPSDGGTTLKFIGIGFTNNPNQLVKFRYDINEISTNCTYIPEDDNI